MVRTTPSRMGPPKIRIREVAAMARLVLPSNGRVSPNIQDTRRCRRRKSKYIYLSLYGCRVTCSRDHDFPDGSLSAHRVNVLEKLYCLEIEEPSLMTRISMG
jgi:hypothetical protein